MRRDFTINRYRELLGALIDKGFVFSTVHRFRRLRERRLLRFEEHELRRVEDVENEKIIILRQDVDRLPENSLAIAQIQKEMGIQSTYYFRVVPQSFQPKVIEEIAGMGHEVGYHYEDLVFARQKIKDKRKKYKGKSQKLKAQGDDISNNDSERELAEVVIESFEKNLEKFRRIVPVNSICMHGSPWSRLDSRLLWKYYDYREFGVEAEPYFDINFEEMLYLTDTGRRWNGANVSVRDKAQGTEQRAQNAGLSDLETERRRDKNTEHKTVISERFNDWKIKPVEGSLMNMTKKSAEFQARYNFRKTNDIICAAEKGELPRRMMMTFHPQRWTNKAAPWMKELILQNTKNVGKYFLIKIRR